MEKISTAAPDTSQASYQALQNIIDKIIGKLGLARTVHLLECFESNTSVKTDERKKINVITTYIISQSILTFNLDKRKFYTSNIREYREARMACYHLLRKYTDCSYAKIGQHFSRGKRSILYYCKKCKETFSLPTHFRAFLHKYSAVEQHTIAFISQLT